MISHDLKFTESCEALETINTKLNEEINDLHETEDLRNKELEQLDRERTDYIYPIYKFNEGQPRTIDVNHDKKGCYMWIECFEKTFPCHIVTNLKGINLEFMVKFYSIEDLVDLDLKFCDKSNVKTLTRPELMHLIKKVRFSNIVLPEKNEYDSYVHGNIIHVKPNTGIMKQVSKIIAHPNVINTENLCKNNSALSHKQNNSALLVENSNTNLLEKKYDFMLVFLYSPVKKRVTVSFSFTSEKQLAIKNKYKPN